MKGKVLLVDDNIDMLLIGQRIFSRAGYELTSARTGQEGLDKAMAEKPDVIILDYMLPDINGSQFIKAIGNEPDYEAVKSTPIVILTARSEYIKDLKDLFALGLRAFLNKPFGHRELVNVIDNIIQMKHVTYSAPSAHPDEAPQTQEHQGELTFDSDWFEDLRIAASTITSLCRSLGSQKDENLSEEQKMDLQAIYTSSKRLNRLIEEKVIDVYPDQETYFA
jgi:two-component system alkaline phosphatase synthesis response regulator PhoP